jgi:uncharacterized BrkB/YihY/UPF0761 family membrane protein
VRLAGIKHALARTYVDLLENHTMQMAAALSYYFVLSFFPALIFLSAVVAYLPVPDLFNQALSVMARFLPADSMGLVRRVLSDVITPNRGTSLSFGILGTLWAASGGFAATIEALNIAYEVKDDRPFWKTRPLAVGLALLTGALMLIALAVMIVGPRFGAWLAARIHLSYLFVLLWPYIHWSIAISAMPSLIEAVNRHVTASRKEMLVQRGAKLAAAHQESLARARDAAAYGWDATPISTARLCAELWAQIKSEDWSLVSNASFVSRWPLRLWAFDKHYQYIGAQGGYGIGYNAPASVGAALANRKYGRLSVNIQCDGDLMYAPGILWTAAHHRIPLLTVMHNNRAYHQEVMQVQIMADRHSRGIDRANIGTTLSEPNIDYAKLAQSMGVHAESPISDPKELGPAIARAIQVVKGGDPALVDVLTQPR